MQKFVLQWHITHKCNLRCKHCYQEDYSCDLDLDNLEAAPIKFQVKKREDEKRENG